MSFSIPIKPVPDSLIREKLMLLHRKLKGEFVAKEGLFHLPKNLEREAQFDLKDSVLSEVSLHMSAHLRLHQKPAVRIMERPSGPNTGQSTAGLFQVFPDKGREIWLFPSPQFTWIHMRAILAHEFTHAFLHQHDFKDGDNFQNEILTDTGAIFLGFGHWIREGYRPIEWFSGAAPIEGGYRYQTNRLTLGYIPHSQADLALFGAGKIRKITEFTAAIPFWERLPLQIRWWMIGAGGDKKVKGSNALARDLAKAESFRQNLGLLLDKALSGAKGKQIPSETALAFQEVQAEIRTGGERARLAAIRKDLEELNLEDGRAQARLEDLTRRLQASKEVLQKWQTALKGFA